jgi:hypothetical protein
MNYFRTFVLAATLVVLYVVNFSLPSQDPDVSELVRRSPILHKRGTFQSKIWKVISGAEEGTILAPGAGELWFSGQTIEIKWTINSAPKIQHLNIGQIFRFGKN